jgi:hypothetical protein
MTSSAQPVDALVCASCPDIHQDKVTAICLEVGIQKAYGRSGDMVDTLKGKDWVSKWQAKVVMAVVTKAQTLRSKSCKIICIQGGRNCDMELSHQPKLLKAIRLEINDPTFRVRVEWMDIEDFMATYCATQQSTTKLAKAAQPNKSSKLNTKNPNTNESGTTGKTQGSTPPPSQQVPGGEYGCGKCHMAFTNSQSLIQHQEGTGHATFSCLRCQKIFPQIQHLENHFSKAQQNLMSSPFLFLCRQPLARSQEKL